MLLLLAAIDPSVSVAVLAAAIGPLGAYFVAARRLSGKIANSDAEQLWEESKAIREWSTGRIESCEGEIRELRDALSQLSSRFAIVEAENQRLHSELAKSHRRINVLETRNIQKGSE